MQRSRAMRFPPASAESEDIVQVKEIMTPNPACCSTGTPLPEVARLMVAHDCGEIPVLDGGRKVVGVITDRDITCRTVAKGRNPLDIEAGDVMSSPAVTVTSDADLEDCCRVMEEHQIRRVPVVDASGACCGMVAQADIARHASATDTAEVVREVSQPH